MRQRLLCILVASFSVSLFAGASRAEVKTGVNRREGDDATAAFKFKSVPSPAKDDAAARAKFTVVDGELDTNGGQIEKLNDGKLPTEPDEPEASVFFNAGTEGGRIGVDLGKVIDIKQINTYSWHPNTRGPQFYKLYGSDGAAADFNAEPKKDVDPAKAGWKLITSVDTRPKGASGDEMGGQYGVSISDADGPLGKFRYLLFDMARTEDDDGFGNTFYSEIDVIAADAAAPTTTSAATQTIELQGKYATIDVSQAPDLKDWAQNRLLPVCDDWYPKIVAMLPSDGYTAPEHFTIQFRANMNRGIPAATSARGIACNAGWFRRNLQGEAAGAVVHEMVHVVQQYGQARRNNPDAARNPGWMVEGVADYVRWFKYEPQTHGANVRNPAAARYDASYRTSANFLNWVTERYDQELVKKMNAAMRQGKYTDQLWKQYTGKSADELGQEWKESLLASQHAPSTTRPAS